MNALSLKIAKSQNQNVFSFFHSRKLHLFALLDLFTAKNDIRLYPSINFCQLVKSLPFHIPEAWEKYPFRAEPPRIGHYREFPTCP